MQHLADELNNAGLTIMRTLRHDAEIPWSRTTIKELVWRPLMQAQLGKRSTTELTTAEIDKVFDTITKYMGEKHGITVAFPSIETLLDEMRENEQIT